MGTALLYSLVSYITLCYNEVLSENSLMEHIRLYTGEGPFSCVHCNAFFSVKYELIKHICTH